MNKQELAAKIWESANQMRSKIEANEYKDYILGFIFYKFLSDKQIQFVRKEDFSDEDIKSLSEGDAETMEFIKKNLGYFITYDNLFSTWIEKGKDFDISDIRDALSAFNRLISPIHKKLFDGIFETLHTGLSKLGESSASQTKAAKKLIDLIAGIPMNGKQDYDVLGFIYEYLISMFAANAGKKAGEFYTPHEVSLLMSEIMADHLKDKKEIQIYDPTSGSGSLLINIGSSVAKHIDNENNIKYFAQELKKNTYNLTRMNLVMRGILPNNIVTRNGDTLEEDWPYFDENDSINSYNPLYVDAVVSNPPYSQQWDSSDKETDPRYSRFGVAPKTKADYAFLLHDLYHIKPDGIMTIVLPHGVLFRGGEEGNIRKNLIENNHIETIIGLPPNIFFGTGIPTVILVLKQKRKNTDVLIVDASKGFIKVGKNNKLRASDIKRIADTVIKRENNLKYSKLVSKEDIRSNGYSLNIPRYVDSSENDESWDIYSSMFGGVPESELNELNIFWEIFPNLKDELFSKTSDSYAELKVEDVKKTITDNNDVKIFKNNFNTAFADFDGFIRDELITKMGEVNISKEETILGDDIFKRLNKIPLIDKYEAFQILDDNWNKIAFDLEIIKIEGFEATKKVDPNMVIKKKDGKKHEVQDGWMGRIIPLELVQRTYLEDELESIQIKENRLTEISYKFDEIIDSLSEEEKELEILNISNDAFIGKEVTNKLQEIFAFIKTDEIVALKQYKEFGGTEKEKKNLIVNSKEVVKWDKIDITQKGLPNMASLKNYLFELQSTFTFPKDSFESKMVKVNILLTEEKELKKQVSNETSKLGLLTKETIEKLSDEQVNELLKLKWIFPLVKSLNKLPEVTISELTVKVQSLAKKYTTTYADLSNEIQGTQNKLADMIDELTANEFDKKGLSEFKSLLKGE